MLRKSFVLLVMGTVIFFLCSLSSADVPDSINYQGKLTTASGGCLNDTVQMTFTIYADAFGTTAEWTEIQTQVVVKEGIFNVLLGSVNPLPASIFDGSAKYLGVQVESDPEMRPLKPIVSVGYAFRSAESDTAGFALSAAPDDDWDIDTAGVNVYRLTGDIGIGTPGPQYKLDIRGTTGIDVGTNFSDVPLTINVPSDQSALISRIAKGGSVINVVDADGNVGIGTTSPEEKLHITGGYQSTRIKMQNSASGGKTFMLRVGVDPAGGFGIADVSGGSEPFFIESGASANLLYLKGSNVGIGTTSPDEKLEVNGNAHITGDLTVDGSINPSGGWRHSGATVFSGTGPTSWTDLDLSSHVGNNYAFVVLKVDPSSTEITIFKPNGDGSEYWRYSDSSDMGANGVKCQGGEAAIVVCETDANGIVEWKTDGQTTVITLLGYIR